MRCEEVRNVLATEPEQERSPETRQHLDDCDPCRSFGNSSRVLDDLLAADADQPPRPGFDTRFFARLEEQKAAAEKRPSWWRWSVVGLAGAAAAAGLVVALNAGPTTAIERDLQLAMDLELIEELELLKQLEEVEALEVLAQVDLAELENLAGEKGTP